MSPAAPTDSAPAVDGTSAPSPEALGRFHDELRGRNLASLYWCAIVFNVAYVGWSVFDWLLDPSHWRQFLVLRLLGSGINTLVAVGVHQARFRRFTFEAFFLWLFTFGAFIVPMLVTVNEAFLAYVLGFTIILFGAGMLPLWPPVWATAVVLSLDGVVVLGALLWQPAAAGRDFVSAVFFLATCSAITLVLATSRYYFARRDWLTRQELRDEKQVTERLRAADRLKDEFLANVSHELRTPLNGIIGLSESMLEGTRGTTGSNPQLCRNLEMISASGKRLANLVNDILDFARLKNHELTLSPRALDLRPVVEVVLALLHPLARSKGLELRNAVAEQLPMARADEDRLQQVLLNLVGNGIKFTERGRVEVRASLHPNHLRVEVVDTGIGIAKDKQELIFESFQQADASISREYGGTGLGLAITRKLVELQGGTLRVDSEPGAGACFAFTLPLAGEQDAAATAEEKASRERVARLQENERLAPQGTGLEELMPEPSRLAAAGRVQVLVVDDEPVNLQVVGNLLGMQGYRIRVAHSGPEALQLIDNGLRPDLILLDVMMPKMSGYEVLAKVRESFPASELPVLLLTAKNQVSDLVTGLEAGANDYLTKPIVKGELLSRIKTHLHLSQLFSAYGRFVPHDFIRHLDRESILDVKLGDQVQKEMAVLFSDIRSFTELSEDMNPRENFNFLNSFLSRVAPVIAESRGFIDQYIGDAVMALFPTHVDDAVHAAARLREAVRLYNQHRQSSGYRAIQLGTGVHIGPLILGTIGYEQRMQTTVIADSVNQASRLEGLTKFFGLEVLMSEEVVCRIDRSRHHVRSLGRMRVKGKRQSVSIYELLDGAPAHELDARLRTRELFERGVLQLQKGELPAAVESFAAVLKQDSSDSAAGRLLERASYLLGHPEARSQDGEYVDRRA